MSQVLKELDLSAITPHLTPSAGLPPLDEARADGLLYRRYPDQDNVITLSNEPFLTIIESPVTIQQDMQLAYEAINTASQKLNKEYTLPEVAYHYLAVNYYKALHQYLHSGETEYSIDLFLTTPLGLERMKELLIPQDIEQSAKAQYEESIRVAVLFGQANRESLLQILGNKHNLDKEEREALIGLDSRGSSQQFGKRENSLRVLMKHLIVAHHDYHVDSINSSEIKGMEMIARRASRPLEEKLRRYLLPDSIQAQ